MRKILSIALIFMMILAFTTTAFAYSTDNILVTNNIGVSWNGSANGTGVFEGNITITGASNTNKYVNFTDESDSIEFGTPNKSGTTITIPFSVNQTDAAQTITIDVSGNTNHLDDYRTLIINVPAFTPMLADYSALDEALDAAGSLFQFEYTLDSWEVLDAAVEIGDNIDRELIIIFQDIVDAATKAINDAIAALVMVDDGNGGENSGENGGVDNNVYGGGNNRNGSATQAYDTIINSEEVPLVDMPEIEVITEDEAEVITEDEINVITEDETEVVTEEEFVFNNDDIPLPNMPQTGVNDSIILWMLGLLGSIVFAAGTIHIISKRFFGKTE